MAAGTTKKDDPSSELKLPHHLEAEQALLGTLLLDNEAFDRVNDTIVSAHFFDPLNRRIYEVIERRIQRNALASPMTVHAFMSDDVPLRDLGGEAYLHALAARAVSSVLVRDYAELIHDAALRRGLVEIGGDVVDEASRHTLEAKDQIVKAEQALYALAEKGAVSRGFQSFVEAMTEAVKIAEAAYVRDGHISGLSTGLVDLDQRLGGLHPSDLIILAGRPSMGKTALATNIAFNIARNHGPDRSAKAAAVGFFSLEMSAEQLAMRVLSDASSISSSKLRTGNVSEDDFRHFMEGAVSLEDTPLFIDDTPALPISTLAARARRLKRQHDIGALFVDYLQLVRPNSSRDSRVNEISEVTQGLKAIAKELNIPVIALSQLSRQVEARPDNRPQLSDLRESGSIEQDADVVMFVYREEYYLERKKPKDTDQEEFLKWQTEMAQAHGKAELIIGKQRHGPIGTVALSFEGEFTRFGNLADESQAGF